jgi:hypothetical protein
MSWENVFYYLLFKNKYSFLFFCWKIYLGRNEMSHCKSDILYFDTPRMHNEIQNRTSLHISTFVISQVKNIRLIG